MMRTRLGLALAGMSVLALGACGRAPRHDDRPMKAVSRLDCPQTQGGLTRQSAAADGRACAYAGPNGATVALTLNAMTGADANPVLDPLSHDLHGELPAASDAPAASAADKGRNEKVNIDLPGVHIRADGDHASVDAGPADGKGGVRVNASDAGAEVHVDDRSDAGVHKLLILANDKAGPHGYRMAAYDARGPLGGPLVVAAVRAKDKEPDGLMHDASELVKRNTGG